MEDKKSNFYKNSYQKGYSNSCPEMFRPNSRIQKSLKIYAVCEDFSKIVNKKLEDLVCLEIGCSAGIISYTLSKHFKMIIGCDIDDNAIRSASIQGCGIASFLLGDGLNLPFRDKSIDVIICNHVYEHVPNANKMLKEIYRILKNNGFCYFAAGNKYMIIEGHYHLPFLSWLPKTAANQYLRMTGKGLEYYENHLSYFDLCKLLGDFKIYDYTFQIIRNPEKFCAIDIISEGNMIAKVPEFILRIFRPLIPTFIFILVK